MKTFFTVLVSMIPISTFFIVYSEYILQVEQCTKSYFLTLQDAFGIALGFAFLILTGYCLRYISEDDC